MLNKIIFQIKLPLSKKNKITLGDQSAEEQL
jgi:hypothetical protein